MAEYDGPDLKAVRQMLGNINADAFQKIESAASEALAVPCAKTGRGNKSKGSTREARLKTALDLVAQARAASVPAPESVVRLLAGAVGAEPSYTPPDQSKPTLTQDQWSVIDTLLVSQSFTFLWKDGALPTKLTSRQVSKKTGVSHATILRWWADPEFRRGLVWRVASEIELSLDDDI